jgi:hypothetical protein
MLRPFTDFAGNSNNDNDHDMGGPGGFFRGAIFGGNGVFQQKKSLELTNLTRGESVVLVTTWFSLPLVCPVCPLSSLLALGHNP